MKQKITTFIMLLAMIFIPLQNAHAQTPGGDVIRFGENYTLKSGETLNGSIIVFGGNVTIEKDAQVSGDIVVFGGNILLEGEVGSNVVIFGGNVTVYDKVGGDVVLIGSQALLKENAVVKGNSVSIGGQVTEEEGASIEGDRVDNIAPPEAPAVPNAPDAPKTPGIRVNVNPLWEVTSVLWRALALAAIAMLLSLFLQPQMERVANTIIAQPVVAGGVGLLAIILTPLVMLLMVITLILIPVAALVALIVPLMWMFGVIALGQEIGERFTKAINQVWAPVLSTGFGAFLLMIVIGAVGLIPCVGWLASFLVSLIALGGVLMTWFNSRGAPGARPAPPAPESV